MTVKYEPDGPVVVVTIDRPEVRNAVDPKTAALLVESFERFNADVALSVAVLTGADGNFCSGFDLKALARGEGNLVDETGPGPMGPTRMALAKPVIAAIEAYPVAGARALALWSDFRIASRDPTSAVSTRRLPAPPIAPPT